MHHALEIGEILVNVAHHCIQADLPSLARTCRPFKELALDVLWEELEDLRPLVRCIPDASRQKYLTPQSFHRPPTQTEWNVLRTYTRRILSIKRFSHELDEESLGILSNPPTTEPLFPNLRSLDCEYGVAALLLHLPLPSLLCVSFCISIDTSKMTFGLNDFHFLEVFPQLCPNVRRVRFLVIDRFAQKAVFRCIRGWQKLEDVECAQVPLDAVAITHLLRIGCLTRLCFTTDTPVPHFDSPLVFPTLHDMSLQSTSWSSVSQFISRVRLPTITRLAVLVFEHPSRAELSSSFASVQTSGAGSTIRDLRVHHSSSLNARSPPLLGLDDLRPCMRFSNLRNLAVDIEWNVGLTVTDLLKLTSAWPCLEKLWICSWGWNTAHGITPDELLQLLQACPLLNEIAVSMNTRGYVGFAPSHETLGPALPRQFALHVIDSTIDEDAVSPVAAFFALISLPGFHLYPTSGRTNKAADVRRWDEVCERAQDMMKRHAGHRSRRTMGSVQARRNVLDVVAF